jgi:hypothetical protein
LKRAAGKDTNSGPKTGKNSTFTGKNTSFVEKNNSLAACFVGQHELSMRIACVTGSPAYFEKFCPETAAKRRINV